MSETFIPDDAWFAEDDDKDDLSNGAEKYYWETDPKRWDTSGDLLSDGQKATYWLRSGGQK